MRSIILLVVILVTVEVEADGQGEETLQSLLKRLLQASEEDGRQYCENYIRKSSKVQTRMLQFIPCESNGDCKPSSLCCTTNFLSVCIAKSSLVYSPKTKTTLPTKPPPPPTPSSKPLDDAPTGLCSTLPTNSLVARGLSGLADMLEKRALLIQTVSCQEVNIQDNCKSTEICCPSPVGRSCFPLSDTSAGSKVWCKDATLC